MRTLIARYAASHLEHMKQDPNFMEVVRNGGEFAEDLVYAATNGERIEPNELEKL